MTTSTMNRFRLWSRRAYLLHEYLIAMLVLLPVPPSRLVWAEEDPPPEPPPPEEIWNYDHSESMVTVSLGSSSSGGAAPGTEVTLQALVETTSWEVWTSSFGNVRTENYQTMPASGAWIAWGQLAGGGYWNSTNPWTDAYGLAEATFVMGGDSAVVEARVDQGGGSMASATLTLEAGSPPEEIWNLTGNGSSLYSAQLLQVEGGTGGLASGETRTLVVEVQQSVWEEWTNGSGQTEPRNTTYQPAENAPVTFYIQSGDGSLDSLMSSVTVMTDSQGRAQTTFTMGGSTTVVAVMAGEAGSGEIDGGSVEFQPGAAEETWAYSSTESSYSLSLVADGESTELAAGEERYLLATVTQTTWEVWTSNYGNTMETIIGGGPVEQVAVYFTIEEGDGMVDWQATSDTSGVAAALFQMGTTGSLVRAWVLDVDGNPLATTDLNLSVQAEEWWLVREEGTLLLNLSAGGAQTGLAPGEQRTVTAEVRYQGWEVWSNGMTEESRNDFDRAAQGAVLTFELENGDGTVDAGPVSTDSEGRALVSFTMGQQHSLLRGDAWFGGTITTASELDFTPPELVWNWEREEEALDVQMLHTPGASTVTARVSLVTQDVYVLASDPAQTRVENRTSSPAMNAEVGFSISSGAVGAAMVWTDADGYATTGFSTVEAATVSASVAFAGLAGSGTAEVEANPLVITTTTLPPGTVGADYTATLAAANGSAPYDFTVVGGNLPSGYNLWNNGILTGVGDTSTGSQQAGTYTFTVQVSDNAGQTAQKELTLELLPMPVPPLHFTTQELPPAGAGLPYEKQLAADGGSGGYTFSPGSLPEWLSLSPAGVLGGMAPAATGSQIITVQVMDSAGGVSTAAFVLTVAAPQLEIVSGDNQTLLKGQNAQPLVVRVHHGGVPVPGVDVAFASSDFIDLEGSAAWNQTETTGADGTASVLPGNSATFGSALVNATLEGGAPQVVFHLNSTIGPFGIVGGPAAAVVNQTDARHPVSFDPNAPRTPSKPAVDPNGSDLSDDAVEVQVRWVSVIESTDLKLKYKQGYHTKENGVVTEHPTWGYDATLQGHQKSWADSQGHDQTNAGAEPPAITGVAWRAMQKGEELSGLDFHDNGSQWQVLPGGLPAGMESLIGFIGGGGGASTVINSVPFAFWMASYAQLSDHRVLQVRLKRKPGHEVTAQSPGAEARRVFILATSMDGTQTSAVPMELTLSPTENETPEAAITTLDPTAQQNRVLLKISLLPVELVAHKRGTLNAPGAQVPRGTGEFGYETVMMENGDSESAANSTGRDCEQTGNLNDYRKTNDDDLVRVVLKFPANTKISGASLKLIHEGMQVDATKTTPEAAVITSGASRLKFYKADGKLIADPDTDLQIPDLANPPVDRYLSKIVTDGEVTIFIEGADKFGDLPISKMARLGGALLKWEFQKGETKATEKLLVYRGGFLRYVQPAGAPGTVGTLEFWDGKGRVRHEWGGKGNEFKKDDTDMGNMLPGASWTAKSGKTTNNPDPRYRGQDYNVNKGYGHTPPGWYRQAPAGSLTGKQPDQKSGTGRSTLIKQGGYMRWKQDDEADPAKRYTTPYRYDASNQHDWDLGPPTGIGFKYNMMPITASDPQPSFIGTEPEVKNIPEAQNRNEIQIHPDGECNDPVMGGTAGCIGIQTYRGCDQVLRVLKNYHSLKVKVIAQ